jgi:hypothetical protein
MFVSCLLSSFVALADRDSVCALCALYYGNSSEFVVMMQTSNMETDFDQEIKAAFNVSGAATVHCY